MPTFFRHFLRLFLLPLCIFCNGCGEIDLPTEDEGPQPPTANDTEKPEDGGDDGQTSDGDDGENPADDGDNGGTTSGDDSSGNDDDGDKDGDEEAPIVEIDGTVIRIIDGKHMEIDELFYLSREEVCGYYGAFADESLFAGTREYIENYKEEELEDWRLPTEDEARTLMTFLGSEKMAYGNEPIPLFNNFISPGKSNLEKKGWDTFSNDLRYLCADGEKTFRLLPGSKVTKSGAKTTYSIRLVHATSP